MTADRREEALDWGDPDDPSWVDPGAPDSEPGAGAVLEHDGAADPAAVAGGAHETSAASTADRRRAAIAAATGVLGGVYLAYSVGWILSVGTLQLQGATLLIEVMYQFGEFLAIIACALWFGAVMALTRGGRPAVRLGWLALGTLVLVPWPFLLAVLR